jgi:DegV family protein with EDD domain
MENDMKQMIRIVTDSSCDLSRRLLERFKIAVVPLIVRFGADTYNEDELSVDEFWEKAAGPYPPQTSQPSIGAFEELFGRFIAQGKQVLCLTVTGKHSGTFNAARLAAQRFGETVKVVDSLSLSLGLGLQATVAAQAARAGHSMQEILTQLQDLQDRTRITIVLDTLENLRRGGRADAFIPIVDRMAQALNIKAIANVVDGQLRLLGAARSIKGGVRRMLSSVEELGALEYLAVAHARSQELAEEVANRLAERTGFPREQIWVEETGAVLASHAGPGVIAVMAVPIR